MSAPVFNDAQALAEALCLAEVRRGFCAPNPSVGAVMIKDGRVVGRGYHFAAGFPHAEVEALKEAGEAARGATLYCTLEPCSHTGRTPPCTDLIVAKGLARVVYGLVDPNPKVSGRGAGKLRDAGILCDHVPTPAIDAFYRSYTHWTETGRPYVTAKLAMSLDGKIAGPGGRPLTITGDAAATRTHEERRRADALLTTARTVRADDPRLDARTEGGTHPKAVYVVDRMAALPVGARLFETSRTLVVLHGEEAPSERVRSLTERGARCVGLPSGPGGLSLDGVLEAIGRDGAHDLWVEAGGGLFGALARARLVDRALVYVAPKWLGPDAVSAFDAAMPSLASDFRTISWHGAGHDGILEMVK